MAHPLFFISSKFFSSDFTDESEAFLLIGLLTDFRGYLASGQWLAPEIFPYCFCHADFANDADFSSWKFFLSHRFRRYTQIFFIMIFLHRISRMNRRHSCLSDYSRIFADIWPLANGWRPKYSLIVFVTQISQMTQIFLRGSFLSHRFCRYTQIFYGISGESLCQSQGGICNDRTGRIRENP